MFIKSFVKRYLQGSSNVYAENRLLKMCMVIIVFLTVVNSVSLGRLQNHMQTHIIPVGSASNFVLTGDNANDDYILAMTRYIIHMVGDVTPVNARKQLDELLTLWDASTYSEYHDTFNKMSDSLEHYPSVSYHVTWDAGEGIKLDSHSIRKRVVKTKMVGDTVVKKTTMEYEINYKIENGAFRIISIKEIGGEQV